MHYEKYLLSTFFDITTTRGTDKNKITMVDKCPYDFIGRSTINWGIQGRLNKLNYAPNPKNSFSLIQIGKTCALWREREWYASQNLFLLKPKFDIIKETFLYFQTVINKEMAFYGTDYNSYPTMESLSSTYIALPTLDKIDDNSPYSEQGFIPDFDYMQKYIEELIVDYLKVIEFNDNYGPINEEPMIRQNHQKVKKFKVGDLFEIKNGKDCHPQQHETDELNGIPMICASRFNNGIGAKLKRDNKMKIFEAGQLTWGKQCPCFFYQEEEFTTGQGIYMLDTRSISKEAVLFLASILDKVVAPNYDYGNCLIGEKLANEVIELPVTADGTPDWNYMEQYIKVIEKVIIQNMIEYKNDQLEYYKQLIKEENHE